MSAWVVVGNMINVSIHAPHLYRRPVHGGQKRQQQYQVSDSAALDEHNLHRIRTMSEPALLRRIFKIQRCDKLVSFIQVIQQGNWSSNGGSFPFQYGQLCVASRIDDAFCAGVASREYDGDGC